MSAHLYNAPEERVAALRAKHAMISARISDAQKSPATTDLYLRQMKKQKLLIKEELEGIRWRKSANA